MCDCCQKACQSCGLSLSDDLSGTEADKSLSAEYCKFCFKDGKFVNDNFTMQDQIEKLVDMAINKFGMDEEDARAQAEEIIPTLKRWNKEN